MTSDEMAKVFKALGNDQRLKIVSLLREWEGVDTCCDGVLKAFTRISEEVKISRSTLSHHFKELEHANLIVCERQGQSIQCKINEKILAEIRDFLAEKAEIPG